MTKDHLIKQTNYYFDTKSFALRANHSSLRIREKQDKYELTLKQATEDGMLETNEPLTKKEAMNMLKNNPCPVESINKLLAHAGIAKEDLFCFGSLTTKRAETPYKNGLLALDYNLYLDKEDYEVEYEVTDRQEGERVFLHLMNTLNIPIIPAKNKVQRFWEEKYKQQGK